MTVDAASHDDGGISTGRHALVRLLQDMRTAGTHRFSLNLGSDRRVRSALDELAAHVHPAFHDGM
ncbi:hypothetical protein [Burkholderia sp. PU8-34]